MCKYHFMWVSKRPIMTLILLKLSIQSSFEFLFCFHLHLALTTVIRLYDQTIWSEQPLIYCCMMCNKIWSEVVQCARKYDLMLYDVLPNFDLRLYDVPRSSNSSLDERPVSIYQSPKPQNLWVRSTFIVQNHVFPVFPQICSMSYLRRFPNEVVPEHIFSDFPLYEWYVPGPSPAPPPVSILNFISQ